MYMHMLIIYIHLINLSCIHMPFLKIQTDSQAHHAHCSHSYTYTRARARKPLTLAHMRTNIRVQVLAHTFLLYERSYL